MGDILFSKRAAAKYIFGSKKKMANFFGGGGGRDVLIFELERGCETRKGICCFLGWIWREGWSMDFFLNAARGFWSLLKLGGGG